MADMPRKRIGHRCGLVIDPISGPEIIVMGGYDVEHDDTGGVLDNVDIYTVNTDSWREGNMIQK